MVLTLTAVSEAGREDTLAWSDPPTDRYCTALLPKN